MLENLKEMIGKRRSVRSYRPDPVDDQTLEAISAFAAQIKPLFPGVRTEMRLLPTGEISFLQKWQCPQAFAFYAQEGEAGLMEAGFRYQQLDLFLQSLGLGSCWVGLGWPDEKLHAPPEGMKLAAVMVFGRPKDAPLRTGEKDFKRKALMEIADAADERLEPVRLAPSATNSQPWFFTHDGETLHAFREELHLLKKRTHGKFNVVDMGIALAHLYVTSPESFRFWREERPPVREGYLYMGSVAL